MRRVIALLSFSLFAACDDRTPLDSQLAPAPSGGSFVSDAGAAPAVPPLEKRPLAGDASVPSDAPSSPPPPTSCAALAAGATGDQIDGFVWQVQVTPGESSAAWDFVSLGYDCGLKVQHANSVALTIMNADDCAATNAWATNARFLEILRTGEGCSSEDGKNNVTEAFSVSLVNSGDFARKTSRCPEPTLDLERSCFRALVDRLIPRDGGH